MLRLNLGPQLLFAFRANRIQQSDFLMDKNIVRCIFSSLLPFLAFRPPGFPGFFRPSLRFAARTGFRFGFDARLPGVAAVLTDSNSVIFKCLHDLFLLFYFVKIHLIISKKKSRNPVWVKRALAVPPVGGGAVAIKLSLRRTRRRCAWSGNNSPCAISPLFSDVIFLRR
jgi:hypothetical protein